MRILGLDIRRVRNVVDKEDTAPLRQRVQRLEIDLQELQEQFSALQGAHAKLRNQFHGSKGGRPPEDAKGSLDAIPHGDKAALRLAAGVRPAAPRSIFNP